jgi:uncharacterized membrane protein HdeD (DUF308 family)
MTEMSATLPLHGAERDNHSEPVLTTRHPGWFILRGVLALALGVAAFLFPENALFAFTLLFAAYAGADGILSLITGIRRVSRREKRWWSALLRGVVGIACAAIFVALPGLAVISYALVTLGTVIAWALLTGAFEIAAAIRLRKEIEGEWLLALSGLLSILLGLGVWAFLWLHPLATILSVGTMIAFWALVTGAVLIALGLRLRKRGAESEAAA